MTVTEGAREAKSFRTRRFRILVDRRATPGRKRDPAKLPSLEIPERVAFLTETPRGTLAVSTRRSRRPTLAVLEEVQLKGQRRLLALFPTEERVKVNGVAPPMVGVLRPKDLIQIGSNLLLNLTTYRYPHVAAPPPELVGKKCPVCTVAFTKSTVLYLCNCGEGLHLEGEDVPADERLECALVGPNCPTCGEAVRRDEGYDFLPEV